MVRFAVDLDVTAGLFDEAVNHAQPQPGALADVFGREEGIEYLVDDIGGYAGPGIAHGNQHIRAGHDVGVHAA